MNGDLRLRHFGCFLSCFVLIKLIWWYVDTNESNCTRREYEIVSVNYIHNWQDFVHSQIATCDKRVFNVHSIWWRWKNEARAKSEEAAFIGESSCRQQLAGAPCCLGAWEYTLALDKHGHSWRSLQSKLESEYEWIFEAFSTVLGKEVSDGNTDAWSRNNYQNGH